MKRRALVCCVLWAACTSPLPGENEAVDSDRSLLTANGTIADEASIYEENGTANGGSYSDFCIGNLGTIGATRRGFIRYTLPAIPAGSTVTRVVLSFTQNDVRTMGGGPFAATLEVRRATSSWDEGTGVSGNRSCGGGSVVTTGVTWATQPSVTNATSASVALSTSSPITVSIDTNVGSANDGLIADVQAWVDGTANNGWRLSVLEEATADNARTITPGTLSVSWVAPNGSSCSIDGDCIDGNCVHADGADCAGRSGCVCCNAATCTGACETCQRAGMLGTCAPKVNGTVCRAANCSGGIATGEGTCDGSAVTCPGPVALACTPYLCSGTVCGSTCTGDGQCAPGFFCDAAACVPIPDGGIPDGGVPDAGLPDAGAPDAGVDAGAGDAGNPDAGSADAGAPDAGTSDAGTSDAGAADAGTTDAGSNDAGASTDAGAGADAGSNDAGGPADAGTGDPPVPDAGTGTPPPTTGCGCGATGPSSLGLALLLFLRRRRALQGIGL